MLKGWQIKDYVVFMILVVVAILVTKFIGAKIPAVGAITDKI